jgi:hypothetical protein
MAKKKDAEKERNLLPKGIKDRTIDKTINRAISCIGIIASQMHK